MTTFFSVMLSDLDVIDECQPDLLRALETISKRPIFLSEDTDLSSTSGYTETVSEEFELTIQCNPTSARIHDPGELLTVGGVPELAEMPLSKLSRGFRKYVSTLALVNIVPAEYDLCFLHLAQYLDDARLNKILLTVEQFDFQGAYLVEYDTTVLNEINIPIEKIALAVANSSMGRVRDVWYRNGNS